jgi:cytochrome c peroxidase
VRLWWLLLVASFGCETEWIEIGGPTDAPTIPDGGFGPPDAGAEADPEFRLGQLLFFDRILSGNRNIACATCHIPFASTTEPIPLSIGEGAAGVGPTRTLDAGAILPRNTPSLFLSEGTESLFWDGRVERGGEGILSPIEQPPGIATPLEALVLVPIVDRAEMRGQVGDTAVGGLPNELAPLEDPVAIAQAVFGRVRAIPEYEALLHAAFPGEEHSFRHLARAIVRFQVELWDRQDSAWDRFDLHGEPLEPEADAGRQLFFGDAGCARCHSDADFGSPTFHNLGVPPFGPGIGDDGLDEGRFEVTGEVADRFAFRTPPLRNVRLTGPWMHNGAYATLEAALRHHLDPSGAWDRYDRSQLPSSLALDLRLDATRKAEVLATLSDQVQPSRPLTEREVDQLLAFLKALDGDSELLRSPDTAVPPAVPSGLPVDGWPGGPHPFR